VKIVPVKIVPVKRFFCLFALLAAACAPPATPHAETTGTPVAEAAGEVAPIGLTPAAGATLLRLQAAAAANDAAALVAIAAENPEFAFSFGDEPDFAAYLAAEQAAGRDRIAPLAAILAMPFVVTDEGDGQMFAWPYFYALEASAYTPEARADAEAIVGAEAAAAISEDLGYLGPRTAIDQNGRWSFYLTGD
jgi:hypothetical protein